MTDIIKELLQKGALIPQCSYNPSSISFCVGVQTNPNLAFPKCVNCKIGVWAVQLFSNQKEKA